jgi:hypothetical protein
VLRVLHGRGSPSEDGPPCLIGRVSSLGCLSTRSPAVPRGSAPPLAGSVRAPTRGASSRCGCVFPRHCTRRRNRVVTREVSDSAPVVPSRVGSTATRPTGGSAHVRHRASRPPVLPSHRPSVTPSVRHAVYLRLQPATMSLSYDSGAVAAPRAQQLQAPCDDNADVVRQRRCRSESGSDRCTSAQVHTSAREPTRTNQPTACLTRWRRR